MLKNLLKNPVLIFIYVSFLVIFIVTGLELSVLRIPLLVGHILILVIYYVKHFGRAKGSVLLLILFLYVVFQGIIIQETIDALEYFQATVLILLYLFFFMTAKSMVIQLDVRDMGSIPKFTLFLMILLLFSFTEWSISRMAGLFGNPNVSAHTLALLLPFCFLTKNAKSYFLVLGAVCVIGLLLFASRSALLAVLFGVAGLYLSYKIGPRGRKPILFSFVALSVFLSYRAVDILKYFIDTFGSVLNEVETRLFYTSYNGRDFLREQALNRLEAGNVWLGLGFNAAKFEVAENSLLSTHDGFLELVLRLGIVGTVLFVVFLGYLLNKILLVDDKMLRGASLMSFIIIISLSTSSSTFFVFNYYFYYFILIFSIAVYSPFGNSVLSKPLSR